MLKHLLPYREWYPGTSSSLESVGPKRIGAEHAHIIRAFEGRWIGGRTAAHAAAHLLNRIVLVLVQPAPEIGEDVSSVRNAFVEQRGSHHGHASARHYALDDVRCLVDSPGDGQIGADMVFVM